MASECSTPFGIYGIVTVATCSLEGCILVCSTPFGIYGIVTLGNPRLALRIVPCAQRLSASTELSPADRGDRQRWTDVLNAFRHLRNCHNRHERRANRRRRCSTPFGIYGIVTVLPPLRMSPVIEVLNAFRHLRNCHPVGLDVDGTWK